MIDSFWKRAVSAIVLTTAVIASAPAMAGGGVGVTFGFGGTPQPYHGYYHHHRPAPRYYEPPPVYYRGPVYAPPPVYVTPPPVYYAPPVYVEPTPSYGAPISRGNCREYQSTAMINGAVVPTYGTACQQPDGTWRMIN